MTGVGSGKTLVDVLLEAQRVGTLGSAPLSDVIERARLFLAPLKDVSGTVVDLGSGAGVPGLVIAVDRPDLRLILVERRQARADALTRAVHALRLADRVRVVADDATRAGLDPVLANSCDAVVSRGFGPPVTLLSTARRFLRVGGILIVTEPPTRVEGRWPAETLFSLGYTKPLYGNGLAMFHVEH